MRRTRSTWIAGALGVGLTASVVLAQQVSNSGVAPQGGAGAPSEPTSLYGAAGSRGARYLLRNGLDYLGYQQYERALKFLRDAEAKEKELSAGERQELKRGIEQAQAGLRAAADAGAAPYALSDRSRRRNGFSPARPEPETNVAARGGADRRPEPTADVTPRTEWAGPVARGRRRPVRDDADARGDAVFGAMARRDAGRSHAEDAPGEPIRLASAEGETSPPSQAGGPAPRTGPGAAEAANASPPADPLSTKGEIPALDAPGLPNLTAVPPSSVAAGDAGARPTGPQQGPQSQQANSQARAHSGVFQVEPPAVAPSQDPYDPNPPAAPATGSQAGAMKAQDVPAQDSPRDPNPATATTPGPAADPAAPAPIPTESAPAPIPLETPDSPAGSARTPEVAPAPSSPAAPAVTEPEASAPPAVSGPATATDAAATAGPSPAPNEATPAAPAEPGLVAPESSSAPAPSGVPALAPAGDAAAGGTSTPAPATGGLVPAGMKEPAAPEARPGTPGGESAGASAAAEPAPAAGRTDIAPLPPLGADATRAGEVAGAPHRESEEPAAPAPGATNSDPAATAAPAVAATAGSDELPPLPTDLGGRDAAAEPLPDPAPSASSVKPAPAPAVDPGAPSAADPASSPSPSDATKAEPNTPAVGTEALSAAPGGPAPAPTAEAPLPTLPDAETGSGPGTPVAPAPSADRAGESAANTPTTAPEPAGPSSSAPAGAADQDAPGAAAPAGRDNTAEERPIPVPQPDAATTDGAATGPAMAPAPEATPPVAPAPSPSSASAESNFFLPPRTSTPSPRLKPEQERKVAEMIARQEKEDLVRIQARTQPQPAAPMGREAGTSNLQTQTQYDISRAPSPAEARPIKAIPVPEDWVPLAPRNWTPQRKYWSAAATCHLPLYFQDPVLERYGHPVEQFAGPVGRYLTYPVDDPNQSTQRMQILQPFFSAGLFALQIAAWPYNAVMDPPWEAQYDLGYYRPGDMVPVDVYWLPLHGYGPPLRGNSY